MRDVRPLPPQCYTEDHQANGVGANSLLAVRRYLHVSHKYVVAVQHGDAARPSHHSGHPAGGSSGTVGSMRGGTDGIRGTGSGSAGNFGTAG
jgi:hypothetical protein